MAQDQQDQGGSQTTPTQPKGGAGGGAVRVLKPAESNKTSSLFAYAKWPLVAVIATAILAILWFGGKYTAPRLSSFATSLFAKGTTVLAAKSGEDDEEKPDISVTSNLKDGKVSQTFTIGGRVVDPLEYANELWKLNYREMRRQNPLPETLPGPGSTDGVVSKKGENGPSGTSFPSGK